MKIRIILTIILFSLFAVPSSVFANDEYIGGDLYFTLEKSPYYFQKRLIISGGRVKIDKGVEFHFGSDSGICLSDQQCLIGDWFLEEGIKSCSVRFIEDADMIFKPGSSRVDFKVSNPESGEVYSSGSKDVPTLIISKELNYLLDLESNTDLYKVDFTDQKGDPFEQKNDDTVVIVGDSPMDKVVANENRVDFDFSSSKKGLIFIEVEGNGEAWYVNPIDLKKYYLGRPDDAFNIMRSLGLGVKHEIIEKGVMPDRLSGRILIDVEDLGKAYYVDPETKKARYLGRPSDAFKLMREVGIGIKGEDIKKIATGRI